MDKDGEHWVAFYIAEPSDRRGSFFFDSYGRTPTAEGLKHRDWVTYLNDCGKWTWNVKQVQPLNTNECGYLCAKFLQDSKKHFTHSHTVANLRKDLSPFIQSSYKLLEAKGSAQMKTK